MTDRVDLDRLADYVGGALDGTPDAAEVRRLVESDPEWAAAHDDLAAAMSSVSVGLRAVGAVVDPVPEDVVARLDDVLRHLGSSTGNGSVNRAAEHAPDGPVAAADGAATGATTARRADAPAVRADRTDSMRPGGDRGLRGPGGAGPAGAGPGRERKRRTARWAAGLSAAAAVIAFGIGVIATFPGPSSMDSGSSAPEAANDAAGELAAPTPMAGGAVISGRDYRGGSFEGLDNPPPAVPNTGSARGSRESGEAGAKANQDNLQSGVLPPELARFQSPAAVEACLDAVRRMFGGVVRVVDLARYEGRPAVVVLLDGAVEGGGRPLVVVAGQRCGETPGTTDEVFHGPLA